VKFSCFDSILRVDVRPEGFAEDMGAVAPRDEVEVALVGGIERGLKRGPPWVSDGTGREPAMQIGIVRGIYFEIAVAQTGFAATERILNCGAGFEGAPEAKATLEDACDDGAFPGRLSFLLDEGGQDYGLVHAKS